jgi:polysaccharide biosynthesis transport protein
MRRRKSRTRNFASSNIASTVRGRQGAGPNPRLAAVPGTLLQNELASALVVFSQDNPRIRILRNQIAALETSISDQSLSATDETGAMNKFDFQLTDIEGQIEYTAAQKADIEAEIEALRISIEATPANMVTLSSLERDYANVQAQYNQAVTRRAQARVGERIEAQSRGQRITVIEPATPPEQPAKPNRRAIATAGVGGGAALGLAVVALIELLKGAVRRPAEITARLGVAPFASIPLLRTRRQVVMRRAVIVTVLLLVATAIPAGLWLLDQHVMPLDMAWDQVLRRTGLDDFLALLRG